MLAGPSRLARVHRRTLFSLPDLVSRVAAGSSPPTAPEHSVKGKGKYGKDGDLMTYHERKVLPYNPKELYSVVADIEAYPSFVPFCTSSRIVSASPDVPGRRRAWIDEDGKQGDLHQLKAELKVGFQMMEEGYVSEVECRKWQSVKASADHTNLFKHLSNRWSLTSPSSPLNPAPLDAKETLVSLDLAFAFRNPLHAALGEVFFQKVSSKMVDAFEKRVREVHRA